jgi:hypothetical protein
MTGYRSVKQGFAKSYQQSREKIEANNNNPTEDLKDALANCPAEVTEIFRTGSLLSHAASRVGAATGQASCGPGWATSICAGTMVTVCRCSRPSPMSRAGYGERKIS